MQVQVVTTVRVIDESGAEYAVTEQQTTHAGGNPRYIAEHVGLAVADLSRRFQPAFEHRFGTKPANGQPSDYPERPSGGRFSVPPPEPASKP